MNGFDLSRGLKNFPLLQSIDDGRYVVASQGVNNTNVKGLS